MTKAELIEQIVTIAGATDNLHSIYSLGSLIGEIRDQGVLDVQEPDRQLYLINFASQADWDCILDDGPSAIGDCLLDWAAPMGVVTYDLDAAKADFAQEVRDTDEHPPDAQFVWVQLSRCPLMWNLMVGDEVVGAAVAREVNP